MSDDLLKRARARGIAVIVLEAYRLGARGQLRYLRELLAVARQYVVSEREASYTQGLLAGLWRKRPKSV